MIQKFIRGNVMCKKATQEGVKLINQENIRRGRAFIKNMNKSPNQENNVIR